MKTYILKRLLLMIPTLAGMTLLTYGIVRLAPGDPIEAMIRNQAGNIDPKAMRESADRIRERLGLNDVNYWGDDVETLLADLGSADERVRSGAAAELRRVTGVDLAGNPEAWANWWAVNKYAFTQKHLIDSVERVLNVFHGYGRWVVHMFEGDFGESIVFRMPKNSPLVGYAAGLRDFIRNRLGLDVWAGIDELKTNGSKNPLWIILDRIPVTFTLNIIAEILIFLVAIPAGLAAARYQGRWLDRGSSYVLLALWSVPAVLAGSLLLGFLARGGLGAWWFPVGGLHHPDSDKYSWGLYLADLLWHAALPVACLVYGGFAYLARLGRASLLENLRADYVRTARAKGLSERRVVYHHALRNSLLPMITTMVLTLPGLLGGSVIVETVFSIQGMGILFVGAAQAYDLAVIMAETLLYGVLTLLFLLVGDILYAWADPRVRYE